jgi:hypothetical protein
MIARTNINTITSGMALWLSLLLLSVATTVFAHEGFDHVMGTVVKTSGNVLTVNTGKANVDVKLDEKTELTKNSQKAEIADLKPGVRVVVDIPEGSKARIAHSVKIGVAAAPEPHAHDSHK